MHFGTGNDAVEKLRDEFNYIGCGLCKHFRVRADLDGVASTCKRLDHKKVRFYAPWFVCYACGDQYDYLCNDFEPAFDRAPALKSLWTGVDDYVGSIPDSARIPLTLKRDPENIYYVRASDFYDGSFIQDGNLRVIAITTFKPTKLWLDSTESSERLKKYLMGQTAVRENYDEPVLIPIDNIEA